jgi:glutathione S-transferase
MSSSSFFSETKHAGTTVNVSFGNDDKASIGLGYWSIRGLGAPLRMMLCAAKVPFDIFLYDIVEDGDGWTSDYFKGKPEYIKEYNAPLWNLPFCVDRDGQRVICQTNAVFTYLGRKCGMLGDDEGSTSMCEQLLCEIYDLRNVMTNYAYGANADVDPVLASAKRHLGKLEAYLELEAQRLGNGNVVHLVGGKFSVPDFHLFEMLDQFDALSTFHEKGDLFADYPRLNAFKEGFAALEENQFYLNSWLHKELPFNNCMARFGSLPGPKVYTYGESASLATWRNKGVVELKP